ncbi:MAG: protein adenylyltransferase SelO family protein, partial [Gemmataceae bacterium]
AYGNQPAIALWNLARLAEALLPLFHPDEGEAVRRATAVLETFQPQYEAAWLAGMRAKLGFSRAEAEDRELIDELLQWMHANRADWTTTFRNLRADPSQAPAADAPPQWAAWSRRWLARLQREQRPPSQIQAQMDAVNPAVIPRNHRVEEALQAALHDDLRPLEALLQAVRHPFAEGPESAAYRDPSSDPRPYVTYCGT